MKIFKHIDEVEAWLEPMNYLEFWTAIAPYNLVLQDREHCDAQLAAGEVDEGDSDFAPPAQRINP